MKFIDKFLETFAEHTGKWLALVFVGTLAVGIAAYFGFDPEWLLARLN